MGIQSFAFSPRALQVLFHSFASDLLSFWLVYECSRRELTSNAKVPDDSRIVARQRNRIENHHPHGEQVVLEIWTEQCERSN
jgi:hypothetical protein